MDTKIKKAMIMRIHYLILLFLLIGINLFAQPNLKIEPRNVRFEDVFSRYDYTLLINTGNQPVSIDSITNQKAFYLLDFDKGLNVPFIINPNDTVKLNITLANFYNITVSDTVDTIFVHSNNNPESPRDIRIKIDFFDDDYGTCAGRVTDDLLIPVNNSKVYFFYWGVYLFDSTITDVNGDYSALLPKGDYTVGASKEGYRTIFSGNTPDPFYAQPVSIDSGETISINLELIPLISADYSVSGKLYNPATLAPLSKGVVVVRKGSHTPTLQKVDTTYSPDVYAGFVNSDGSYSITVDDSAYYFVQGYTGYFLPSYYNTTGAASVFWQEADTINLNSHLISKDIYLTRDSSYGAGKAYGYITLPGSGGNDYDGISIFAQSTINNSLYSYNFSKKDGSFNISNLPYGSYRIVAQKIGYENAVSEEFVIDAFNPAKYGLEISFKLSSYDEILSPPTDLQLYPNYPNPFNPGTTISFSLPETEFVKLKVYNIIGEEIAILVNDVLPSGNHTVKFSGDQLTSGVYIVTLEAKNTRLTQKILLLK